MSEQDGLSARFADCFGAEPDGIWSAPGRVNLIGEHVDYAGGLCLPFPLRRRTVVAARRRADRRLRLRSTHPGAEPWDSDLDQVRPGYPPGWAGYPAGVLWALRDAGHPVRGVDLLVGPTVPPGAGLASSGALECAVALAADSLFGLGLAGDDAGLVELARVCRRAENEVVGAPTGGLDQTAALCCTPGHALLLDFADDTRRQIPFDPAAAGYALLVFDTRTPHQLADGGYADRRRAADRAATLLGLRRLRDADPADLDRLDDPVLRRRARHVVTEIERVRRTAALLEARRVGDIGPLLDGSHRSLRDDLEVSTPELDCAAHAARQAGAVGARLVGGGFGGSVLALVPAAAVPAVTDAVQLAAARAGHPRPVVFSAAPGR